MKREPSKEALEGLCHLDETQDPPLEDKIINMGPRDSLEHRNYTAEKVTSENLTHYVVTSLRTTKCRTTQIQAPKDVYRLLHKRYIGEHREVFKALYLNTKNQLISLDIISIGSLNASIVHPREVLKPAIMHSAASIILAHNHPSGDPTPSREDSEFTQRMAKCGELIGIRLLDHIVIGDGSYTSLKERGDF